MAKMSKRRAELLKKYDLTKAYPLADAVEMALAAANAKQITIASA